MVEDQPAGWTSHNMAHSMSYPNAPITYIPQSSFPVTHSQFGSYTNPTQQQPQFTFTLMNAPSNTRSRTLQHEQIPQEYQPGAITRGIFTNAIESVQTARRRTRRNPPPPVTTHSDRKERKEVAPRSNTNNEGELMDQVHDAGVVTDLQDNEIQEEAMEIIEELLFKLKQITEDRDHLIAQLRAAKRKHVIPVEEREQPPLKQVDRGP